MADRLLMPVSETDHSQGNKQAPVTLVEYGDYQCPFCGAAYPLVKRLQRHFGEQLRFVFRNFPLAESHRFAVVAALAAEAAGRQGKFWEMHDTLYENQDRLEVEDLIRYAESLKLNIQRFESDIRDERLLDLVQQDYQSGEESGVEGTPSFYMNDKKYVGAYKYDDMRNFIQKILDSHTTTQHP